MNRSRCNASLFVSLAQSYEKSRAEQNKSIYFRKRNGGKCGMSALVLKTEGEDGGLRLNRKGRWWTLPFHGIDA